MISSNGYILLVQYCYRRKLESQEKWGEIEESKVWVTTTYSYYLQIIYTGYQLESFLRTTEWNKNFSDNNIKYRLRNNIMKYALESQEPRHAVLGLCLLRKVVRIWRKTSDKIRRTSKSRAQPEVTGSFFAPFAVALTWRVLQPMPFSLNQLTWSVLKLNQSSIWKTETAQRMKWRKRSCGEGKNRRWIGR